MAKKLINRTHISGLLYEHNLELKVTGENSKNPGTEYITGTISIATDDGCVNIVPIHFTYVTATTNKGSANATYTVLKNILDGSYKTIMADGKDNAAKMRVDSVIGLNEFYSSRNSDNGELQLVSVKRNEGGFVHVADFLETNENERNTFDVDMVITGFSIKEADEERNLPEKGIIKGCVFDFRGSVLPVEFSVLDSNAIGYFSSLEPASNNPVFTRIKGQQISEIVTRTIEEESAWGAPHVREVTSTHKDFVVTWAARDPYDWDSEETLTAAELVEKMTERETYLATLKQRQVEYSNANNAGAKTTAHPTTATGNWNF